MGSPTCADPVNFNDLNGLLRRKPEVYPVDTPWFSAEYGLGGGGGSSAPLIAESEAGSGRGSSTSEITFEQAFRVARRGADDIGNMKNWSKDCERLLSSLGTTGAAIAEAAKGIIFIEAPGSTVYFSSLYANTPLAAAAVAQYGSMTVNEYIAQNPSTKAVAELKGKRVYLNQKWWGGGYYEDLATVMHELVHNVTGLGDSDISRKLEKPIGEFSPLLKEKCL